MLDRAIVTDLPARHDGDSFLRDYMGRRFLPLGPKMKDHTGERFGRLVVLGLIERGAKRQHNKWLFRCECGKEHVAIFLSVQAGRTRSCGCLRVESAAERATKHGLLHEHSDVYNIW